MALTYQLTDIEDWRTACFTDDGHLAGLTQTLIFATLAADIGHVTDDSAAEFYARLKVIEKVQGAWLRDGNGAAVPLTIEHVRAHVGLRTNAPTRTRAQWARRVITDKRTGVLADFEREYRKEND